MTAEQTDNVIRKMLERFDCQVGDLLDDLSDETLDELKADPPFWVTLMNIDLDFHKGEREAFVFD